MDGYAIMFEDLELLSTQGLTILPPNKAGNPERPTLTKAHAIKTFTGSIMPLNADTLVIVEHITHKDDKIFLNAPLDSIRKSQWIRQVGDNYKENEILLHKGDKIGAFEVGLLAELNQSFVQVYQKAKVGILCVGDEIIEVGQDSPHHNVVRSVNTHLLESLLLQMGQEPIIYPIIKDDKEMIQTAYIQALKECDILLTTGLEHLKEQFIYTQNEQERLKEQNKQELQNAFKALSADILAQNTQSFNQSQMLSLQPLREEIQRFTKQLSLNYETNLKQHTSLETQIHQLHKLNLQLSTDAHNLTNALKGENKTQGNWGEVILQRVLENSGLQQGREYEIQQTLYDDSSNLLRPDAIIKLPKHNHLLYQIQRLQHRLYKSVSHLGQNQKTNHYILYHTCHHLQF